MPTKEQVAVLLRALLLPLLLMGVTRSLLQAQKIAATVRRLASLAKVLASSISCQKTVVLFDDLAGVDWIWVNRVDTFAVVEIISSDTYVGNQCRPFEPRLEVRDLEVMPRVGPRVVRDDSIRAFPSGRAGSVREVIADEASAS